MTPQQYYTILMESAELKQENARLRFERDAALEKLKAWGDDASQNRLWFERVRTEMADLLAENAELRKIEDLARAMIERLGVDGVSS